MLEKLGIVFIIIYILLLFAAVVVKFNFAVVCGFGFDIFDTFVAVTSVNDILGIV